jgi:hypothetical protein
MQDILYVAFLLKVFRLLGVSVLHESNNSLYRMARQWVFIGHVLCNFGGAVAVAWTP